MTNDLISFNVAFIIPLFPVLNLASFFDEFNLQLKFLVWGLLSAFNCFYFVYENRFINIQKNINRPSKRIKSLFIVYMIGTLIVFLSIRT